MRELNKKRQVNFGFSKTKNNFDENLQLGKLFSEDERKEKLLFLGNFHHFSK
jgi:hypothetical protein